MIDEEDLSSTMPSKQMLATIINKDLLDLKNSGTIPAELIESIHSVKLNSTMFEDPTFRPQIFIKRIPDGKYDLELTLLNENPKEKNGRYLIQYSIYDSKSKNLKWEKFRIYNR